MRDWNRHGRDEEGRIVRAINNGHYRPNRIMHKTKRQDTVAQTPGIKCCMTDLVAASSGCIDAIEEFQEMREPNSQDL